MWPKCHMPRAALLGLVEQQEGVRRSYPPPLPCFILW